MDGIPSSSWPTTPSHKCSSLYASRLQASFLGKLGQHNAGSALLKRACPSLRACAHGPSTFPDQTLIKLWDCPCVATMPGARSSMAVDPAYPNSHLTLACRPLCILLDNVPCAYCQFVTHARGVWNKCPRELNSACTGRRGRHAAHAAQQPGPMSTIAVLVIALVQMTRADVLYGTSTYLQVLRVPSHWLTGARAGGNEQTLTRNALGSSYEQEHAVASTCRWKILSTLGTGQLDFADPLSGACVQYGTPVYLQVLYMPSRWLSGARERR